MLNVDLPQLEALATVIEEGSFDAAARRLHVTPSAISQRIKAFEIAAGAVLLQRSKPVRVTEAGIPFLRLALQIRSLVAVATVESTDFDSVTIALAVNADSLNTWVLPALAGVSDRIDFDIRREDQDESAELLRQGIVMAAVTAAAEPVQGCSVTRLGVTRYRPMCTPAFRETWFADGPSPQALSRAPMIVFDRTDDLQDRYMELWGGSSRGARRNYVPSSADFLEAVRLGIGWAVLPQQQIESMETAGELVDLAPSTGVSVTLYWQQWSLRTAALDEVSAAIVSAASAHLE
ncbi:LysR family transcriptional regulator ArgP [Rhodococcoides fascians]|uniref:LysR family transcriptional regulator ArgP n=1 Tax=Rhodococcoides fascians TaxID=1828 RepID=UPI00050CE335|nr:LysR family transcriptional regulator ArgP [Rhodococcus fascians]